VLLVDIHREDLGRAQGIRHEHAGVVAPRDDVDLLARELGHDRLDPSAALSDGGPDRIEALLARRDGDLRPAAGLTGDGLDLDRAVVDLRDLELEEPAQEALVGAAHEDLRTAHGAPDLEHEGLDVLPDPVVLELALLGRGEDGLHVLADVEDDRPRLDPIDGPGDELALAARELVEDLVALDLADALEHDLLGGLGPDPTEDVAVQLLGLHEVPELRLGLVGPGLIERDLGQLVLDLLDHPASTEDADATGVGVDADVDVLVARDPPVRGLDAVLDGPDELLPGDLLLGVQLQEGAHEISTHDRLLTLHAADADERPVRKKTWGSPTSRSGRSVVGSIHPDAWTVDGSPGRKPVQTGTAAPGYRRAT
jgi:hypothetical protein